MNTILKLDEDRRRVYGIALIADQADSQGDIVTDIELEDAACRAVANGCAVKVDHSGAVKGRLVASWPMTKDIATALGFTLPAGKSCWLVGLEITDSQAWAAVKAGDIGHALSIGGSGEREAVQ